MVRAREGGEEGESSKSVGKGDGGLTVRLPDLEDGVTPSEGKRKFGMSTYTYIYICIYIYIYRYLSQWNLTT